MKNIHILPTDKPSRLWVNNLLQGKLELSKEAMPYNTSQNIYITSDEEIKEGDWVKNISFKEPIFKVDAKGFTYVTLLPHLKFKKVVLTLDQDLIKDGVQAIDDEFLEWFVKNPSCEKVEVEEFEPIYGHQNNSSSILYKIIIPKEEPKQETLEEAAEKYTNKYYSQEVYERDIEEAVIFGAKWQQEQQDKFAIGFAEWLLIIYNEDIIYDAYTKEELLEIYKKENEL